MQFSIRLNNNFQPDQIKFWISNLGWQLSRDILQKIPEVGMYRADIPGEISPKGGMSPKFSRFWCLLGLFYLFLTLFTAIRVPKTHFFGLFSITKERNRNKNGKKRPKKGFLGARRVKKSAKNGKNRPKSREVWPVKLTG